MVAVNGGTVKVTGAKELRAVLKKMGDKELLRELGAANRRIADGVVAKAKIRAHTKQEQGAASRLRAGRGAAKSTITLGGKPYDLGAEFGAKRDILRQTKRGTMRGWNMFKPHVSGAEAGYFLFPTIRAEREQIIEEFAVEIEKLWKRG